MICCYLMNHPYPSSHLRLIYFVFWVRTKNGEAEFSFSAPHIWNKVPESCRSAKTLSSFKSRLKTLLFAVAFKWTRFKDINFCISLNVNFLNICKGIWQSLKKYHAIWFYEWQLWKTSMLIIYWSSDVWELWYFINQCFS